MQVTLVISILYFRLFPSYLHFGAIPLKSTVISRQFSNHLYLLNLSLCRRNTSPVDLSPFLRVFGEQLRHRDPPIDINAQQDVPEILEILLEELVNSSNLSQSQLATCLHYEYVCSCGNSSSSEESMMVLPVPVVDHISKCMDKLLLTQTLSDENRWFCNVCNAKQDSTLFVELKKVPNILILHLKRFINNGSNIFRDNSIFSMQPLLPQP